jgi:DNA helicase II / ATP-dependent DNA helicase PcrA
VYLDRLLKEHAAVRRKVSGQCRHILVDEYQDTNRLQGRIAALLSVAHGNLMVVGDEAQSIYAFRGATVDNILRFPDVFKGAQVTVLEENYRSTQPILDLANGVLHSASQRYDKTLHSQEPGGSRPFLVEVTDETEQPGWIVEQVLELREEGVPLQRMAVLFRSAWHANLLEMELNTANIPFRKFGGIQFMEASHVKDLLALLRIVANPCDALSWFRVLQWFDGVGRMTAQRIMTGVLEHSPPTLDPQPWTKKRYGRDLADLAELVAELSALKHDVSALVSHALDWFMPRLPSLYDDAGRRVRDLDAVPLLAEGQRDLDRFLADVSLDPPASVEHEATDDEDEWLTLSTVHSAKGLEWHTVFVLGLADGHFPSGYSLDSDDAIEEERRLLYVAVTRAQRNLYLFAPRVVQRRGYTGLGQGCRLLDDITNLDERVDRVTPGRSQLEANDQGDDDAAGDGLEDDRLAAILGYYE